MKKNVYIQPIHYQLVEATKHSLAVKIDDPIQILILYKIEEAFRSYCKAHSAGQDLENLEWTRFKKFLMRNL